MDIPGYEGLYQASSLGRVRGVDRTVGWRKQRGLILKQSYHRDGYLRVTLHDKSHSAKSYQTHRLIGTTFISNPDGLPQINHKDENKTNNKADNLEWCSRSYNCKYGHRNDNTKASCSIKVRQLEKEGGFVKEYSSMQEAGRMTGISVSHISAACSGKRNIAGGYKWMIIK